MLESAYQSELIKRICLMLPGCIILKNDAVLRPGVPDLVIFYRARYAMLEVKAHANARHRPNQDYYVELFDKMSFAAFIYPENEEEVLRAVQQTLKPGRSSRTTKS